MPEEIKYFTKDGLQKLKDELERLLKRERPAISIQIADARDKGDLSENAEYVAAKEMQGLVEKKIAKLKEAIGNARVIDSSKRDLSKVRVLSLVKIRNIADGTSMVYTLVDENEVDIKAGKISIDSPVGKGLMGKKAGDKVKIIVPSGIVQFEIVEILK
ncbi:MAG: transcription elongation factor GreA [Bacteroidota bacterium]